jgi:hypothetical protein
LSSPVTNPLLVAVLAAGLAGCANPYDPGQRAIGGAAIGAGAGATLGGLAGGGRGALTGAMIGGAIGALGGASTTPQSPSGYYRDQRPPYVEGSPQPYYDERQQPQPYYGHAQPPYGYAAQQPQYEDGDQDPDYFEPPPRYRRFGY